MTIQRIRAGSGHWYKVDGQKYDGVTTLLGDGLAKKALINWAANSTIDYAIDNWDRLSTLPTSKRIKELQGARNYDRDQAARRGTEVHHIAEQLVQGFEVPIPEPLRGHVESYLKFLNEWDPVPVLVETPVANRTWRYCGTLDLVADMRGQRWILDVKTARSGIFSENAMQLAAYRYAECYATEDVDADGEALMALLGIERAAGIHVRADGYDLIPLRADRDVFEAFLHVATVARTTKTWDEWRGDALTVGAADGPQT